MKISRTIIPAKDVASLCWCGDTLVDWAGGGAVYKMDGTHERVAFRWGFPFDSACATPDGRFAVVYQRNGTKAVLLRDGEVLRELNRSYYCANAYEYPVCIWQAQDGRTLLAHCPEEYRRIDIDEAETGRRLTDIPREPEDFFHSRLMVNRTGTRLLSAGWIWHPWDTVAYYELGEVLADPRRLDGISGCAPGSRNVCRAEEGSACWQTEDRVLLGSSGEKESEDPERLGDIGEPRLHTNGIAIYDVASRKYIRSIVIGEIPGTMMPIGDEYVVCFYKHPKLVSLDSGEVVCRWEDIETGDQASSITWNSNIPPLALDPRNGRFAVFGPAGITVLQIQIDKSS